jgi:H+/Cl- antiporter ClcA
LRAVTTSTDQPSPPAPAGPPDPAALLRSPQYIALLVMGALVGVPVAFFSYWFLKAITNTQTWVYETLPDDLGLGKYPTWWPVPVLMVSGLLVGLILRYLPGTGGHRHAEGFKSGGATQPRDLPAVILAAFATLALGTVLGPEAPLIAIGSGIGVVAVRLVRKGAPESASVAVGAAGSFAAISTLLGSPLTGAFLLMEAAGLGGGMMSVMMVPGLLAAGVGSLVFIGLDNWTGYGTFSLAVPQIPPFGTPTLAQFLWAIGIGIGGAVVGTLIRRVGLLFQPIVERRKVLLTPLVGGAVGLLVVLFTETTDRAASNVLFSGQNQLPGLIETASGWTVGALVMLCLCKGLAYALSLSSFRGGPVFPGMFVGAAAGIALSHLPGLPMIAGAAMGIGAMTAALLQLPLVAVLLPTLFLQADGVNLMPLVIVSVVVSYVISARILPKLPSDPPPKPVTDPSAP